MRTKQEVIAMVKSRKLGRPVPQLDDLYDMTAIYPFLTFKEAVDLLKVAGGSHYYYWDSTTPEAELKCWMKIECMDSWPDPLAYTRNNLLKRLKHWRSVFQHKSLFDKQVLAAGKAIFWIFLYALEDGEVLIDMAEAKGTGGMEFYALMKLTDTFYADEFAVMGD